MSSISTMATTRLAPSSSRYDKPSLCVKPTCPALTSQYDLWAVTSLAKRGPEMAPALLPHPLSRLPPSTQPRFSVVRSEVFDASLYPGYAHRRTIGHQAGISTDDSLECACAPYTG